MTLVVVIVTRHKFPCKNAIEFEWIILSANCFQLHWKLWDSTFAISIESMFFHSDFGILFYGFVWHSVSFTLALAFWFGFVGIMVASRSDFAQFDEPSWYDSMAHSLSFYFNLVLTHRHCSCSPPHLLNSNEWKAHKKTMRFQWLFIEWTVVSMNSMQTLCFVEL